MAWKTGLAGFHNAAIRETLGSVSLSSSSCLPTTSAVIEDVPVTFVPGRARLAINPVPTGSDTPIMTIRNSGRRFFGRQRCLRDARNINVVTNEIRCELSQVFKFSIRPAIFDFYSLALGIAQLAQSLAKRFETAIGSGGVRQ